MACGIAVATTVFSVVDAVAFRPLPFPDSDRLVSVYGARSRLQSSLVGQRTWDRQAISLDGWRALQRAGPFQDVGAWSRNRPQILGHPGQDIVEVWYVSASLPSILGANPVVGREFTAREDDLWSDVVLLTYECWMRRYGGRADVVGTTVTLRQFINEPDVKTVVGVLSPGFRLRGPAPEFLLPLGQRGMRPRHDVPAVYGLGRLAAGASIKQAAEAANSIVPKTIENADGLTARVVALREDLLGEVTPPVWLLAAATASMLLITCGTVAAFSLREAHARRPETAIRLALGASHGSLVRPAVVEQSIKVLIAAPVGLGAALALMQAISALMPPELIVSVRTAPNTAVWAFGVAATAATMLAFGVGPVLLVPAVHPKSALAGSSPHATIARRRLQIWIVAGELALSLVLMASAAALGDSLRRLTSRPLGFDPSNIAVASFKVTQFPRVTPSAGQWPLFASWTHTEGLLGSIRQLPNVVDAAGVSAAPFSGTWGVERMNAVGRPDLGEIEVQIETVTEDYFRTMGIALQRGRGFRPEDRRVHAEQARVAVVVSSALELALGGLAIGRSLHSAGTDYEIVGVVQNTRHRSFGDRDLPTVYVLNATYSSVNNLVIRTLGDPMPMLPSLRRVIREYDPTALVTNVTTLERQVSASIVSEQFRAAISILFGAAALLLAAFGVYGLVWRMVEDRRREIGIRCALGATPGDVAWLVLGEGTRLLFLGLVVGLPVAAAAGWLLRPFLFEVSPIAPELLLAASVVLASAVMLAVIRPVRRAARVNPAIALYRS
jgi:predicted permease